jgi:hypothetical protein
MAKPTAEELDIALKMAVQMREKNLDPYNVAKCLLNHNFRIRYLEEVMRAADRYINMGMSDRERTHLLSALNKARDMDSYTASAEQEQFGLE